MDSISFGDINFFKVMKTMKVVVMVKERKWIRIMQED